MSDHLRSATNQPTTPQPTHHPPSPKIGFSRAVALGFSNYANFQGRATRSEFWYWLLFGFLVSLVSGFLGNSAVLISALVLLIPGLAIAARRLHDVDRSGWWQFAPGLALSLTFAVPEAVTNVRPLLLGIGGALAITIFIWAVRAGQAGPNRYGPCRKETLHAQLHPQRVAVSTEGLATSG